MSLQFKRKIIFTIPYICNFLNQKTCIRIDILFQHACCKMHCYLTKSNFYSVLVAVAAENKIWTGSDLQDQGLPNLIRGAVQSGHARILRCWIAQWPAIMIQNIGSPEIFPRHFWRLRETVTQTHLDRYKAVVQRIHPPCKKQNPEASQSQKPGGQSAEALNNIVSRFYP